MKKILVLLQMILTFFSFFLGFIWLDRILFPLYSEIDMESKIELLEKDKYSIFIMGNSHSVNSYIPNLLNQITINQNFINYSTSGVGLNSLYFYLENAIQKNQKPDLILLETYSFYFDEYDQSLFSLKGNNYIKSFYDIQKFIHIDDHLISYSSLFMNYNYQDVLKTISKNFNFLENRKENKDNPWVLSKGYRIDNLYEIVSEESFENSLEHDATKLNISKYEKIFEKFLFICDRNNIEVILIKSPSINIINKNDQYSEELAEKFKIKYIDLNQTIKEDIINPRNIFFDGYISEEGVVNSHTNHYGAQYSSLKLVQYLNQMGYLELDENMFNYYWEKFEETMINIEK